MIIPVIFSLSPAFDELMYTWVFYKGIDLAKQYGWPVFAQRQYFENKKRQAELGLLSEEVAKANEYEPYSKMDDSKFIHLEFSEAIIERFKAEYPSQTDAYLASCTQRWPEMTEYMLETIRRCETEINEKTEALLCICSLPFIEDCAKALNVPILHFEWGPFRKAGGYRNTAYLDLKGSVCDGEMKERYESFRAVADRLPIFSANEILSLFLSTENLHSVTEDVQPEYECGLALGYNIIHCFNGFTQISSLEMLNEAHKYFEDNQVVVRYHPGDPIRGRLPGVKEIGGTLIDFIRKCKRICCINSNVAFEAMLLNRPAYEMGTSQYGLFCNRRLTENGVRLPDRKPSDEFLSFIAFGYLIPFELLRSVKYLRWRLNRPSEEEIYRYHVSYYLKGLGIPEKALQMEHEERLSYILDCRDINKAFDHALPNEAVGSEDDLEMCLRVQLMQSENRIKQLELLHGNACAELEQGQREVERLNGELRKCEERAKALENLVQEYSSSTSWQMTAPVRMILQMMKGVKTKKE